MQKRNAPVHNVTIAEAVYTGEIPFEAIDLTKVVQQHNNGGCSLQSDTSIRLYLPSLSRLLWDSEISMPEERICIKIDSKAFWPSVVEPISLKADRHITNSFPTGKT